MCVFAASRDSAYLTSIAYRIFFIWLIPPLAPPRPLILLGSFTWLLNGRRGGPRLELVAADWRVQC